MSSSTKNSDAVGKKVGLQFHREFHRSGIWKEKTAIYVIKNNYFTQE